MSAGNPYNYDPNQQGYGPPRKSNTGIIVAIVVAVVAVPVLLACAGVLVALLLPAVQASREAARRMSCSNNMKQIGLALHNYHDAYKAFPPAYTVDANGKRLHSWRTLILPFVEQKALYDQIDLDKPWDDPVNLPFANLDIPVYHCPSTPPAPGMTTYVAVVDPNGVFQGSTGTKISQITDGTSNTLLLYETDVARAVQWMSPDDLDLPTFVNAGAGGTRSNHAGGSNICLADGSVMFFAGSSDATTRQNLVIRNDGQMIQF